MPPDGDGKNGIVARVEVESLEKRFEDCRIDCRARSAVLFGRIDKLDERVHNVEKAWWKLAGGMGVVTAALILFVQWLLKL